jgi:hypothetical protein
VVAGPAAPAVGAPSTACQLITRAQARHALGTSVSLTRGEDSSLCNLIYGRPKRDIIMAFKPNVRGRLGFAAQRHAYRTHTERDALGTVAQFTETPLAIRGAVGFEAEVLVTPPESPPNRFPDRYLILLRHHRILSLETTLANHPASFAQLQRLARSAIKRF